MPIVSWHPFSAVVLVSVSVSVLGIVCWVLGVGCWVLGVGVGVGVPCSMFGVGVGQNEGTPTCRTRPATYQPPRFELLKATELITSTWFTRQWPQAVRALCGDVDSARLGANSRAARGLPGT
jgi:hypothetical protein